VLMGVGHLIHYEVPELAAQAIEAFLEERGFVHRTNEEHGTT
jgi:hypothetical protein